MDCLEETEHRIQPSVAFVWQMASLSADITSSFVMRPSIDMPTILSPHRSITPARLSQPSSVGIEVMSLTIFWPGLSASKFLFRIFSATGRSCLEFVVALYFLWLFDRMPFSRIMRSIRLWLTGFSDLRFISWVIFLPP